MCQLRNDYDAELSSLPMVMKRIFFGKKTTSDFPGIPETAFAHWKLLEMRSINFLVLGGLGIFLVDVLVTFIYQTYFNLNTDLGVVVLMAIFVSEHISTWYELLLGCASATCLVIASVNGGRAKSILNKS